MASGSVRYSRLPNLLPDNHVVTSCQNPIYNCIAWAVDDTNNWWWPGRYDDPVYWPPGVPRETTIPAFLEAFGTRGYEECKDGDLEAGYEKVALYAGPDLVPTHAARQLDNGRWTSKLGNKEDIEHKSVNDVNGPEYGAPVRFMRRRKGNE